MLHVFAWGFGVLSFQTRNCLYMLLYLCFCQIKICLRFSNVPFVKGMMSSSPFVKGMMSSSFMSILLCESNLVCPHWIVECYNQSTGGWGGHL